MAGPAQLTISGYLENSTRDFSTLQINPGWNLIGNMHLVNLRVSDLLSTLNYNSLWSFNGTDYIELTDPNDILESEEGYWVNSNEAEIIDYF